MFKIFKYSAPLGLGEVFTILLPSGAELLAVQLQFDVPVIWARIPEPAAGPPEVRGFFWAPTGWLVIDDGRKSRYVGTVQLDKGFFVLHLFEALPGKEG